MSGLDRAADVVDALCRKVGFMCGIRSVMRSEADLLAIDVDVRLPSAGWPSGNTEQARRIFFARLSKILLIDGARDLAQFGNSVVCSIAKTMVNLSRPYAVYIQPRQAVRLVRFPVNLDGEISLGGHGARNVSNPYATTRAGLAGKDSSIGIVVKKLAKTLGRKTRIRIAHAVALQCNGLGSDAHRLNLCGRCAIVGSL